MVGRVVTSRAERRSQGSSSLPIFERLAPAAPLADIAQQIEVWTKPGDVVVDLNGRGGWVARAAIAAQRRAADLESLSLPRLLADVVVRPPDVRHLDAAAQAISVRPLGDAGVKKKLEQLFAGTCTVCGRPVVLDALVWEPAGKRPAAAARRATGKTAATGAGAVPGPSAALRPAASPAGGSDEG